MVKVIFWVSVALIVVFAAIRMSHNYVGDNFNVPIPTWQIILGCIGAIGFAGSLLYWGITSDKQK